MLVTWERTVARLIPTALFHASYPFFQHSEITLNIKPVYIYGENSFEILSHKNSPPVFVFSSIFLLSCSSLSPLALANFSASPSLLSKPFPVSYPSAYHHRFVMYVRTKESGSDMQAPRHFPSRRK